ncbi:MAG TPA: M17 family peptidase N-terminal domain-containing protein, partial [Acidimicrobiia bacterium]
MSVTATLSTTAPAKTNADVLAVPVFSGRVLGPGGKAVDTALGGTLGAFMEEAGFEGKAEETLAVPAGGLGARAALLVGLGDKKTVSADRLRRAAAAVVRRSPKAKTVATTLLDAVPSGGDRVAAAQALAEGAALGAYKFLRYKQKSDAPALERFVVLGKKDEAVQKGLDRGVAVAAAVAWARDLVNEPAGAMTPTQLAEEARRAAEEGGLEYEVLDEVEIANQGLGGLLGVSLG